jgi:hypothetical protein
VLSRLSEAGIQIAIRLESAISGNHVVGRKVAHSGLEKILLYRPFHQIVVNTRFGDTLVVRNRLIIIGLQCRQICYFQVELVGQSVKWSTSNVLSWYATRRPTLQHCRCQTNPQLFRMLPLLVFDRQARPRITLPGFVCGSLPF